METYAAIIHMAKMYLEVSHDLHACLPYIYIFLNKAWQQFRPRIKITALCHPKARAEGTSMLCQLLCPCCWQTVPGLAPPEQAGGKKHPFSQPLFGDVHAALPSDVLCSVWKAQFGRFLKPATSS